MENLSCTLDPSYEGISVNPGVMILLRGPGGGPAWCLDTVWKPYFDRQTLPLQKMYGFIVQLLSTKKRPKSRQPSRYRNTLWRQPFLESLWDDDGWSKISAHLPDYQRCNVDRFSNNHKRMRTKLDPPPDPLGNGKNNGRYLSQRNVLRQPYNLHLPCMAMLLSKYLHYHSF